MLIQLILERKQVIHPTAGDTDVAVILFWLKFYVALQIFIFFLNTSVYVTLL